MPIHGSLFHDFREESSTDQFALQNKKLLKIQMGHGPVMARTGSMVAYQGDTASRTRARAASASSSSRPPRARASR